MTSHAEHSLDGSTVEVSELIGILANLVDALGPALPPTSELLLHDLSKLPNSIVAISGHVTSRRVGDPATDLLLRAAARGTFETRIGYETRLPDGRRLQSSTVIVRDQEGAPVAALCVNTDLSAWHEAHRVASLMLGISAAVASVPSPSAESVSTVSEETFTSDVDELALTLIEQAIAACGVPVELMRKRHKVEIVRELSDRGFFMLKGAADKAASALSVSRFTIYNYLNEISGETDVDRQDEEKA